MCFLFSTYDVSITWVKTYVAIQIVGTMYANSIVITNATSTTNLEEFYNRHYKHFVNEIIQESTP